MSLVSGPVPPVYVTSILGLQVPMAVGVTPDGTRLYVAEGEGDRTVRVIYLTTQAPPGTLTPPGTEPGTRKPMGIAVASSGVVYVVDRLRTLVDLYDPAGQWLGTLADPPYVSGAWQPLGVAVNAEGEVYVTNGSVSGPAIAEYDAQGRFITTYGTISQGATGVSYPNAMALAQNEYMFVSDSNHSRIVVMNTEGNVVTTYGGSVGDDSLALPRGTFIDRRGFCYVTDATSHVVKVWDVTQEPARFLFSFGEQGSADGQLLYPNAVAVDSRGRIYIADTGNDRIQIWAY
ncbi:MAG: hypothetical protein HY531_01120 [Chloroflexi bacterium]|nr:hypothetical protein [Chloroflexota bacterium]